MSQDYVKIRYDGPALADHAMDVNHLAPALLALGDLCKIANNKFNQDRASVKVLFRADTEQNCIQFYIQIAIDIYTQVKALIGNDDVASAKEILEWLGIIIIPSEIAAIGLFQLIKRLKGKQVSGTKLVQKNGKNLVEITINGDNNYVYVVPQTYELYRDAKAIKSVQDIVRPVTREGYETLEFEQDEKNIEKITREEAKDIVNYKNPAQPNDETSQVVTAWLQVYGPVYDRGADYWRFNYGENNHIYADISETNIAEQTLERGGTSTNDLYKVSLEITQKITDKGKISNHYKIVEVLDFKRGSDMGNQVDFVGND